MAKRALVAHNQDEQVVQVVEAGSEFPVSLPLEWVDADDDVTTEHKLKSGVLEAPAPQPAEQPVEYFDDRVLAALGRLESNSAIAANTVTSR